MGLGDDGPMGADTALVGAEVDPHRDSDEQGGAEQDRYLKLFSHGDSVAVLGGKRRVLVWRVTREGNPRARLISRVGGNGSEEAIR